MRKPHSVIAEKLQEDEKVREMNLREEIIQSVIIEAKYEGYLGKQERLAAGMKTLENRNIPYDLDYNTISHLALRSKGKTHRVQTRNAWPGVTNQRHNSRRYYSHSDSPQKARRKKDEG